MRSSGRRAAHPQRLGRRAAILRFHLPKVPPLPQSIPALRPTSYPQISGRAEKQNGLNLFYPRSSAFIGGQMAFRRLVSRGNRNATIEVSTAMRSLHHESRWFRFLRGSLILLTVPLVGCTLGPRKQAVLPPPPKPVAVQPPAPDPPLSIPQTAVTLPSPQPVNPDAIPSVQTAQAPAPGKTEALPAPHTSRPKAAGPPKPGPEPEPEAPPPPPPAL